MPLDQIDDSTASEGETKLPPPPPGAVPMAMPEPPPGSVPMGAEKAEQLPPPPPGAVPLSPAPQWTRTNPLVPKTQEEIDAAPVGSWVKTPTGMMVKPEPKSEAAAPAAELDYSGLEAAPRDPGFFGIAGQAFGGGAAEGIKSTYRAVTGRAFEDQKEKPKPDDGVTPQLLKQNFSEGWSNPNWWVAQIAHGAGSMVVPVVAGAVATRVGGPYAGAAGFGLGSGIQELAPAYQRAREQGLDHDQAVDRAWKQSGIAAAGGVLMGVSPALSLFGRVGGEGAVAQALKRPISEALAQIFGVQPAIGAAQQVASGLVEGHMPTADELATGYAVGVGMGVPMVAGHHVGRRLLGRGESAPEETPPAQTEQQPAPVGAPPAVGETVGIPMGDAGVRRMTVTGMTRDGDVVLIDPEGIEHVMAAADVARLRTATPEASPAEPAARPVEGEVISPARALPAPENVYGEGFVMPRHVIEPEPVTLDQTRQLPPPTVYGPEQGWTPTGSGLIPGSGQPGFTMRPEGVLPNRPLAVPPASPERPATRSLEDLNREVTDTREAATGRPEQTTPDQQLAEAERDLAAMSQPQNRRLPAPPSGDGASVNPAGAPPAQPGSQAARPVATEAAPMHIAAPAVGVNTTPIAEPRPAPPPRRPPAEQWADQIFETYRDQGAQAAREAFANVSAQHRLSVADNGILQDYVRKRVVAAGLPFSPDYVPERPAAPAMQSEEAPTSEAAALGVGENGPKIIEGTHTKTGVPIVTVQLPQRVGSDEFKALGARARKMGGYYSSYRAKGAIPGFIFKTREAAEQFARLASGETPTPPREEPRPRPTVAEAVKTGLADAPPPAADPAAFVEHIQDVVENAGAAAQPEPHAPRGERPFEWTEIGKNIDGDTLWEDARGVRSIVKGGVRRTEPVGLRPTRGGMEPTTDRAAHPEYQIAEPVPGREPEFRAPSDIERIGNQIAEAREATETEPSDAQKASGHYAKGRVDFHGIPFVMENPQGSIRRGVGPDGVPWESELPADYGYISRSVGADGDHVDAYIGHDLDSRTAFVIDQFHPGDGFDEHKVMLGFKDWPTARQAYLDAFSDGSGVDRLGNVSPMSLDALKDWLRAGDTKNPVGQAGLPFGEPLAVEPRPNVPTLDERPPVAEEMGNGIQRPIPHGDEGARPEALHGAAEVGATRPAPSAEDLGSARLAPRDIEGQSAPEPGAGARGGGDRAGDADRVPAAGERAPGEPGAARRPEAVSEPVAPDAKVQGANFTLSSAGLAEGRSPRVKARDNLAAIELSRRLAAADRPATREEQAVLAKYVGWGGLSGAFPDARGQMRKGLEDIGHRLKDILTPAEYEAAARSTQYAHYTSEPVIRSMWNAMERMGFKGGSVFEPGMGIGHFLGFMPGDMAARSRYHGLEIDPLTAQIAKQLYPQSGVRQGDFIRTPFPEGAFDIAIGNPPFADIVVGGDPKYASRKFLLHDYFFAKSLDSVRPGGLLGFVTSAGTMNKLDDAARRFMAERAEFVGGVRLPSSAFAKNAGTEVTTDILFFKKRLSPVAVDEVPDWAQTVVRALPDRQGNTVEGNVSRYFSEHPEQVLGEEGFFDKLAAGVRYGVRPREGEDLPAQLEEAIGRLPQNVMDAPLTPHQKAELDFAGAERKDGSFYLQDGRLMQYRGGAGRAVEARGAGVQGGYTAQEMQVIRGLLPIRDSLRDAYRADLVEDTAAGTEARERLNAAYDGFVKKHGPINKVEFTYRRPSIVQQENARAEARENAREAAAEFQEGDFDPSAMIARGARAAEIARARASARLAAEKAGRRLDEGTFDPADMPDLVIEKRQNIDPFMDDPESYRLRAIENYDEKTGEASKRRIFYESVLTREQEPEIRSAQDGVLWTLNKFGRLDVDAIAAKLGTDRGQVIEALGDSVYRRPGTNDTYEPRDAYLSGDVKAKLEEAQAAAEHDPELRRNVEALEKVQPAPLSPSEISIRLGMPWVPVGTVRDFMRDHLRIGDAGIAYNEHLGQWVVDTRHGAFGEGQPKWGTNQMGAHEILSHALNRQTPKIYDTVDVGGRKGRVLNVEATQSAQDKVFGMREEFTRWVEGDPARVDELARLYNDRYNRVVLRQWDGSYLTTPGVAKDWEWRPHQTRVIARIIQSGNTYMAHAVGAGKTSAAIGSAMEMRRLGLVNKPMVVVPNHMLGQFAKEWYEQYPTARLMVADERRFHTDRRRQFVADVAQQDLDGVVITNSAFKRIGISREFEADLIREEVEKLDESMRALGQDPDDLQRISRNAQENRITVKKLQNRKQKLEERLSRHMAGDVDLTNTFEELGIDFLFVDEAHSFRKLAFASQVNLKGISPEGSDMAWDLYAKARYLENRNPGRSLVLMSGTPVTNTMGELYTVSRYIQRPELEKQGLGHFDSWAQTFGDTKAELEQTAQGTYETVTRFASLNNVPELYKMVGQVMDVVTPTELSQYVTRPELKGGERQFHLAPRTDLLDRFQTGLAERVEKIKQRKGPPKKGDDILLSVINDGRLAAIDPRLVVRDAPNDPSSKLNQMIENVHRIWQETKRQPFYQPGTEKELFRGPAVQLVFSNLGVEGRPIADGGTGFSAYQWIKRDLVRRGVPAGEIAFIKDYPTPLLKQRLFNDINEGKVRILVGSTQKMGTGLNVQRRLYATHNLDPLWYPSDDEQRVGRILRQGNLNPRIEVHDYSTKGTYDSTMWQMMGRKGRFIEQFFRGDPTLRNMEDLGEASLYEQAAAMSTSDERVIRLTELRQELQKVERQERAHASEQYGMRFQRGTHSDEIAYLDKRVALAQDDIAKRRDISGDNFTVKVGAKEYAKRDEAGKALDRAIETNLHDMQNGAARQVGEIAGFPIILRRVTADTARVRLQRSSGAETDIGNRGMAGHSIIRDAEKFAGGLEADIDYYRSKQADLRERVSAIEGQIGREFPDTGKIEPLREQIAALEAELAAKKETAGETVPEATREARPGAAEETIPGTQGRGGLRQELLGLARERAPGLTLDLVESLDGKVGEYRQAYRPGGVIEHIAAVALGGSNPRSVLNHETIHFFRGADQFTPQEWSALQREAPDWRGRFDIDGRYPDLSGERRNEEAIAEAYAAWDRGDLHVTPPAEGAFARIREFLSRLGNWLRGNGFQTADDVFARAASGEIGARPIGQRIQEPRQAREEAAHYGQTLDDFIEAAPAKRLEAVIGPPGTPKPPAMTQRFLGVFGLGPRAPGRHERWFNPVEKLTIAPANAARYDIGGVSRQKYQAETDKTLRANALQSAYVNDLQPYINLRPEDARKVNAALELERLQGRETPLDGRAIILRNADAASDAQPLEHQPLAQNSRPGDVIRLDTPELIAAFTAHRKTMSRIYDDYVQATAKRYGWDGDPTYSAIMEHAYQFPEGTRDRRHWEMVGKLVGLAEDARRTAYVPFMRQGDYFFRVTPREGSPLWNGEGPRPTTWYSRIESRLPEERLMGGTRSTSHPVEATRAELRKAFPEGEFDIEEGYYRPSEDALRNLDLPAIEELFNLVGRNVGREWRDRIRGAAPEQREALERQAQAEQDLHDNAVSALLDRAYEAMKAGYKKKSMNVAGYNPDLTQTTGLYTSWLAHSIADMEHRPSIEAADRAVDQSYDPMARDFWHNWDREQDRIDTPLDYGLNRLKNAAFYWALGGNAATAIKNMLDGPMMGLPVLSTGMGPAGRAKVAGIYLNTFRSILATAGANAKEGITVDLRKAARTPAERALIEANEANGRLHARGTEELGAIKAHGQEAFSPKQNFARRVLEIWASNFSASERAVRGAMLLGAYRMASQPGAMEKINRTWGRDALWAGQSQKTPERFAEFMVDRTAGLWGRANRSEINRSRLGGMVMQFHSYEQNWLSTLHQQMWHMGPEGKVTATLMLGGLGMLAGAVGLPFAQDIEKAYEWTHKLITGVDPNLEEKFLQLMKDDPLGLGENAGRTVLYGIQPFGIDLGSMGMGQPLRPNAISPLDMAGAAASIFVGAPIRAHMREASGQSALVSWSEMMPSAVKNLTKALGVYPTEGVRTLNTGQTVLRPMDITGTMRAQRAVGFRPAEEANTYRERERGYRLTQAHTQAAQALNRRVKGLAASAVIAQQRGDQAEAQRLFGEAAQVIQNAPPGVKASLRSIRDAELQAINPNAAAIRAAPRAVRPQVAVPLNTGP